MGKLNAGKLMEDAGNIAGADFPRSLFARAVAAADATAPAALAVLINEAVNCAKVLGCEAWNGCLNDC